MKEKTMERMRLDKYLAQTAGLTRSEAKQYLKKGRVCGRCGHKKTGDEDRCL